ncbi:MAG: hypothetical protein PF572_01600 [Patescibacteria group bacterium]|jgi:hypothetical protein|nr:hypothetical protein [Patescibacteria group bacterium]
METFNNWTDAFVSSFQNLWFMLISFIPEIIGALLVLIIGWLIAKTLGRLATKFIKVFKLDYLIEKVGLKKELDEMGLKFSVAELLGSIVKWFFIIVTLIAVANVLRIPQVTSFLERIAFFIPEVIAAIFIVVLGMLLGSFLKNILSKSLGASGVSEKVAVQLGNLAKWIIFVFAFMAAIVQLGVAVDFMHTLFTGFVAMLTLAGGLAFGLGGRDKAAKFLDTLDERWNRK